MRKPIKYVEKGLQIAANGAWVVFGNLNKINQRPSFTPTWSDKPLLKSYEKTKPPLGWPRETDSLCPTCTREARQAILDGHHLEPVFRDLGKSAPRLSAGPMHVTSGAIIDQGLEDELLLDAANRGAHLYSWSSQR